MPEVDLIHIAKIIKQKEKLRDKLLGRKSVIVEDMKALGYTSVIKAGTALAAKKKEVERMKEHYKKGETAFKKKYKHLLEDND